jgi:hypothetical protein
MSVRNLKKKSETDWARIDAMTDEEIDFSDIPPLDDAFFERAVKVLPRVRVDRLDLIHARKFAAQILVKRWSHTKNSLTHDAFNTALIVWYTKPFSVSRDFEGQRETSLDRRIDIATVLNEEEIKLHDRVKDLRNKYYAHSDAQSVLIKGMDYSKDLLCIFKAELNLPLKEVELLKKIINKWINYLDDQISLTKAGGFLIAPDAES